MNGNCDVEVVNEFKKKRRVLNRTFRLVLIQLLMRDDQLHRGFRTKLSGKGFPNIKKKESVSKVCSDK